MPFDTTPVLALVVKLSVVGTEPALEPAVDVEEIELEAVLEAVLGFKTIELVLPIVV